uniref:Uncharacterized protein n=1 Tax=Tanacetum cinerariifolium TaxID=118510 RepID=A0A6L2JUK8_TANCI|nr:hypothetical protein [Tanacetum cinerariifolium]
MGQFGQITHTHTYVGEGSRTPTEPHHTPSPEAQQTSPTTHSSPSLPPSSGLPPVADEPASPIGDVSQGEACPIDSGLEVDQDTSNIPKTSTLPSDSTPRVTSLAADEGTVGGKDRGVAEQSGDDASIKGRSLDEGEEAAERVSDDTEEMETVLTSMDAAKLPIGRRIELISDLVKYQDNYAKVLKYQTQQRKPLTRKQQREFYTSVLRNQAGWKAKHFKGMSLEEIKEKFDPVWKQIQDFIPVGSKEETKRFKRKCLRLEQESVKKLKTSEEVKATEEVLEEKVKEMMQLRCYWKIIRLGGSSASYQFFVDMFKHLDREDLNQLWELVKETLSIRPATSDKEMEIWVELKRLYEPDVKDQLWTHTQNLMHAPVEWKLYDTCGVHHVTSKDKEIFMLVEKDYPLRKGLAIEMISYKLQVENYSKMANDLIMKIYKIASSPRQQDD